MKILEKEEGNDGRERELVAEESGSSPRKPRGISSSEMESQGMLPSVVHGG